MNQLLRLTRKSLQQLSYTDLVELVLTLFARIGQLTARINELEAQVNKNCKNAYKSGLSDRLKRQLVQLRQCPKMTVLEQFYAQWLNYGLLIFPEQTKISCILYRKLTSFRVEIHLSLSGRFLNRLSSYIYSREKISQQMTRVSRELINV
jgi:hypothetical protein